MSASGFTEVQPAPTELASELVPGRTPAWARGEPPNIAEAGNAKMRREIAAQRLHTRSTGRLPLDPAAAAVELTEQQRALRSTRPRHRRWKALDKYEAEVSRLTQKRADAHTRLHEAEEALQQAPDRDAKTLAAWIARGETGDRPAATQYERQRDLDAARLLVEAVVLELDKALERKQQHVEQNRSKMLADLRAELERKVGKLRAEAQQLPALRQAALEVREDLLWLAKYPEPAESFGFASATALGLRKPIESTLGTKALVQFEALVAALEEDATAIRDAFGPETAQALGVAKPATPLDQAMWDADVDPAWKREQLEKARGLLPWSANPEKLAAEAGDFRP